MNDTLALMLRHKSIRRYRDQAVPDADIRRAVEAGQAASTSSSVQSYGLIHVTDVDRRRQLVALTGGQEKVARCGAFFVVVGDARRHRLVCGRADLPFEARLEGFLLAVIDATLFAQNLVLAFESMGYGICYIGGLRNRLPETDRLLEIPEGVYPLYGLCVGVPDEDPAPRPRLPLEAVLMDDRYHDDRTMLRLLDEYDRRYLDYLRDRGAAPRSWSQIMAEKFSTPRREELASYYATKGANLG